MVQPSRKKKPNEPTAACCWRIVLLRRSPAKQLLLLLAIALAPIVLWRNWATFAIFQYRQRVSRVVLAKTKRRRCAQPHNNQPIDILNSAAVQCLKKTQDTVKLEYPSDAEEHFYEIRRALAPWAQHASHKMHTAAGYGGPWIENHWIAHFEELYDKSDLCLLDHFGPYIPLFVPWVDIWVNSRYSYPPGFVEALYSVLRPNVPYITVSQNDEGLTGKNEILMSTIPNVLVLSAGGYGHVPIPLFKQVEPLNNHKHPNERQYDVSYTGSLAHSPKRIRETMHQQFNSSKIKYQHYYGRNWRQVMENSRFSLTPRGYGRTAYHLVEILQMGLIPIHIYADTPWVPYADLYPDIGFVNHYTEGMNALIARLKNMTPEQIMQREQRIVELRDSHFSVQGVLDQIQRFILNEKNDLRCQKLPATVRDV